MIVINGNDDFEDKIFSPPPGLIGWRRVGGLPLCFGTREPVRDMLADKLDGDPEHEDNQRLQNQQEDNEHRQNEQSESQHIQYKHGKDHYI